jgi:hypothetical protein
MKEFNTVEVYSWLVLGCCLYYKKRPRKDLLAAVPEVRVRFPALPHFLRSNGSVTGFTQSLEYN